MRTMSKGLGIFLTILGSIILVAGPILGISRNFSSGIVVFIIGLIIVVIGTIVTSSREIESFIPDNKTLKIADNKPCTVCGKEGYTWGRVASPQAARFRTKTFGPIWSGKPIMARTCDNCGHIDLFIKHDG